LTLISGAQFRRDIKLAQKRGKDLAKLREVFLLLVEGKPLSAKIDRPILELLRIESQTPSSSTAT